MAGQLSLEKYHHLVIVARDAQKAVNLWSRVFRAEAPKLNDLGPFFRMFRDPAYPSLLRGKRWDSDFKQAVFPQHSYFFELNEAGTGDNFAEFAEKHGNGVAYLGFIAGENREDVLKRLETEYGCETVVEQFFPGGDWSVNYAEKVLGIDLCVKKLPGGDHTQHPLMPDFSGVTIVTDRLEDKIRGWRELFGVQRIERTDGRIRAADLREGPFPVTLAEAGEEGPFSDFYRKHGSGVFQISIPLEGEARRYAEAELRAAGIGTLAAYELFGRKYTVYDSSESMGVQIALEG